MNYRGSYRHLIKNSQAAMLAAIEIYNKPNFHYRDECFVILLLNAWELALKAVLSKNKRSIYYPKAKGQPYRTYSVAHALVQTQPLLPAVLPKLAVSRNLDLVTTYRDNAVHFYNKPGFGALIYGLGQKATLNYVVLLEAAFGIAFRQKVTWQLLPVGLDMPVDPVEYMKGVSEPKRRESAAVREFVSEVRRAADEIKAAGGDPSELMVTLNVTLQSVKKIDQADVVVGVEGASGEAKTITVVKKADPNRTHPLSRADVLRKAPDFKVGYTKVYVLAVLMWKYKVTTDQRYCWVSTTGARQFSNELVQFLKKLSKAELETALTEYRANQRRIARQRRRAKV